MKKLNEHFEDYSIEELEKQTERLENERLYDNGWL